MKNNVHAEKTILLCLSEFATINDHVIIILPAYDAALKVLTCLKL